MFHLQTMPLLRTLLSEAISDVTGHIRAFLLSPHTRPPPPDLICTHCKAKKSVSAIPILQGWKGSTGSRLGKPRWQTAKVQDLKTHFAAFWAKITNNTAIRDENNEHDRHT